MQRTWTRAALAVLLLGGAAVGALLLQRIGAEREYRRLLAAGESALALGESYRAVESFSGALAFRPDSMVAYLRRGDAYRAQRRFDEAVRDWREASRLAPAAPQPLVALGDLFDANGDFTRAAEWFGQAAERLKDEDPSVLYRLALARYRSGSPAAAIDPLERAVARQDSSPEAHYLLGLLHRDTGNPARAIQALESAVTLAPGLNAAREELADLYRAEGRPVDEMTQLQALARDGQTSRKVTIGLAEARQGQYEAALGTLSGALASAPGDSRVLLAIGRVYLARAERTGDPVSVQRAVAALEQALGGTARRSEGLALFGRALYLSGKYAEAERLLLDAVATSPADTEAFAYLADAADRIGHDLVARDALVNLDVIKGDTAGDAERLLRARRIGALSLRLGEPRVASTYLSRAVEAAGDDGPTLGLLAEARWRLGDEAGARLFLARALAASPADPAVKRLSRLIR